MYRFGKAIGIIGIFLSIALIVMGVLTPIPNKKISMYSFMGEGYTEYVGGDAYNIQIEASLRGGEIAGATAARAIFISFGVILLFLSFAFISMSSATKETVNTNPYYKSKTTLLTEKLAEANSVERNEKTWKCKCGFENPEHADSCRSCGAYK